MPRPCKPASARIPRRAVAIRYAAAIASWATRRFALRAGSLTAEQTHPARQRYAGGAVFVRPMRAVRSQRQLRRIAESVLPDLRRGGSAARHDAATTSPCDDVDRLLPDFDSVPDRVWQNCELLFICTPGNPTGAVMSVEQLQTTHCSWPIATTSSSPPTSAIRRSTRTNRNRRRGLLQACAAHRSRRLRALCGLPQPCPSDRTCRACAPVSSPATRRSSNAIFLYRTYHGCAMPAHVQHVSELAWADETHVIDNRTLYRAEIRSDHADARRRARRDASPTPASTTGRERRSTTSRSRASCSSKRTSRCCRAAICRDRRAASIPASNRIRMAMVAELPECIDAARTHRPLRAIAVSARIDSARCGRLPTLAMRAPG